MTQERMEYGKDPFPYHLRELLDPRNFSFPQLIARLWSAGAFRVFPPLQFMFRELPASGILPEILRAATVEDVMGLAGGFSAMSGFRRDCVDYLLACFCYALRLTDELPLLPDMNGVCGSGTPASTVAEPEAEYSIGLHSDEDVNSVSEKSANQPEYRSPAPYDYRWAAREKERFLSSLMELNRENEHRLGVSAGFYSCSEVGNYGFKVSAEMNRKNPGATGALWCAVYSRDGRILFLTTLGVFCYDSVSPLPVMVSVPADPAEVGRILLYWE